MQTKKIIIPIIAILVIILLILGFLTLSKKSDKEQITTQTPTQVPAQNQAVEDNSFTGNLFDLAKLGKSQQCTYSSTTEGTQTNGVTYISGNNVRSDFTIVTGEQPSIESHMISDGEWVYAWTNAMPTRYKMKFSTSETDDSTTPDDTDTTQNIEGLKENYDFKCSSWNVDEDMFVVPTDVEFMDFSAVTENLNSEDTNGATCAVCNYMTDEADKAACLANLGC